MRPCGTEREVAVCSARPDQARGVDEAGGAHLGNGLNDAGAADAGDLGAGEGGVVGPEVAADDAEAGLFRDRVNLDALDGAGGGALAGRDLRALEGGTRGGGAGEDAGAVAEEDLGVGADVDHEHQVVGELGRLREGDGGGVGAHVAGNAGQDVDAGVGVEAEFDLLGPEVERVGGGEREGCLAELGGVDAEQEVVHDRVADDHGLEDQGRGDAGFGGGLDGQRVEGLSDRAGHLLRATGVHHRVGDAAHQVFAEADLRVHQAGGGADLAGGEIAEVAGDGGRADVDGEAVDGAVVEARPDVQDARLRAIGVDGTGDLPVALAQRGLQHLQGAQVALDAVELPLLGQRPFEALQVTGGLVHVWFGYLDVVEAGGGVEGDGAGLGALADHLAVDLALGRDVDDGVGEELGLAAEAAAGGEAADAVVALLDGVEGGERVGGDGEAMLGERAEGGGDLAPGADAAPAADRVEIDAELTRGGENGGAGGEAAALAGRGEDDEWVSHAGPGAFRGAPGEARARSTPALGVRATRGGGRRCGQGVRAVRALFLCFFSACWRKTTALQVSRPV